MVGGAVVGGRNYLKWGFFAVMAVCLLLVLYVDERFLFIPSDKEWTHIAPFKWLLAVHGVAGVVAMLIGPFQFSDRLRAARPKLHRWMGRTYLVAIAVAAGFALYIGPRFEPQSIQIEQYFQGGGWLVCTAIAWICILQRNIAAHKLWMMRSYGFVLVFVTSRVPDAFMHMNDQVLSDVLWGLVVAALIGPDLYFAAKDIAKRARR